MTVAYNLIKANQSCPPHIPIRSSGLAPHTHRMALGTAAAGIQGENYGWNFPIQCTVYIQ